MSIEQHDTVYVDGTFMPALTEIRMPVVDPATGNVIAQVPACGVEDVDRAVAAARSAFDRGPWPTMSPAARADTLTRLADALGARTTAIAETVIREAGFASRFAEPVHVTRAIDFVRYYADLARKEPFEEVRPSALAQADVVVRRCPVGVVSVLVPWNIPLLGALSKIAPALAAGCTVIYKPSPETPQIAYRLAEAVHEAGFPPGVVNILPADLEGSQRMSTHPDVDMVAFTGSTDVGRKIALACATDFRRYSLELGGNAAAIILEDAPVESVAAGLTMTGLALNNGEACIAQRRILAPRSRYDEIVSVLAAAANSLQVGDPTHPDTVIGPMITEAHRDRVLDYIHGAIDEGAVIAAGGGIPDDCHDGYYLQPTVLAQMTNDMRAVREEIFGPVVCVIPYDTVEEAISIARDTEYGLSSSVWTNDLNRAEEIARQLRVGSVYVNGKQTLDPSIPFGGFGHSGVGRELGPEGLAEYSETQAVFMPSPYRNI
ncbi:aldehyde dehydrogenase [Rhodococcus sp. ACT016]|uniref:aldehyde dehydrogenase n=1 Tax=Rhodococcus sp. ACT016 TaxID=3134808 RepID=UPI003D2C7D30